MFGSRQPQQLMPQQLITSRESLQPQLPNGQYSTEEVECTSFNGYRDSVTSCSISANDGKLLTGSVDKTAYLYSQQGTLLHNFIHQKSVLTSRFSNDGSRVLTGGKDNIAHLWELDGRKIRTFIGHTNNINVGIFTPQICGNPIDIILTGSADQSVRSWYAQAEKEIEIFRHNDGCVYSCALSSDSNMVLMGSRILVIWDRRAGKKDKVIYPEHGYIRACAISPDDNWVLTGGLDNVVDLWNIRSGNRVLSFVGHTGNVYACAFSPDGNTIMTASEDKTVRLWDVKNARECSWNVERGKELRRFTQHTDAVYTCAFRHDGKKILTGSKDRTARLWNLSGLDPNLRLFSGHAPSIPRQVTHPLLAPVPPPIPLNPTLGPVFSIPSTEIVIGRAIGHGSFGNVYRGTFRRGNYEPESVAIKELNNFNQNDAEVIQEAGIMVGLCHPNLVKFYGACVDRRPYRIVMELMTRSLWDLLSSHDGRHLSWPSRTLIAIEIAKGLQHLHNLRILHRDLKSDNVLLDAQDHAKISDFGLAKMSQTISSTSLASTRTLNPCWRAPELLQIPPNYSEFSDVYAYATILWEITSCQRPFSTKSHDEVREAIRRGEREKIPENTPDLVKTLITRAWKPEPSNRPRITEVLEQLERGNDSSCVLL